MQPVMGSDWSASFSAIKGNRNQPGCGSLGGGSTFIAACNQVFTISKNASRSASPDVEVQVSVAIDPKRKLNENFAVMHNAAEWLQAHIVRPNLGLAILCSRSTPLSPEDVLTIADPTCRSCCADAWSRRQARARGAPWPPAPARVGRLGSRRYRVACSQAPGYAQ